ncbi:MAG: hypothetical protein ACP5OP_05300 [Leptospirillia bacterium]
MAGKRSYETIARRAGDLSRSPLRRLGCRWSPDKELILKEGIVAAQTRLEGPKGHEIPTVPKLLESLDLTGKVVTADALHPQNALVLRIREKGGDDVFTVKVNRKTL